jgi:protein gp37
MLEIIDLGTYLGIAEYFSVMWFAPLDWVICGGMTGPKFVQIMGVWVARLRDQCIAADVPFFFKGWGGDGKQGARIDWREWKQFPEGK